MTAAGAVSDNPKKEKLDEIINYEINKVVSKTVMPVGETKKLSIAVLVDGKYKKNEKNEEVYQALTKNEIESLEDLVRKSAGFNAATRRSGCRYQYAFPESGSGRSGSGHLAGKY